MTTGETDEEPIVSHSEFVASLATTFKEPPLELSDETSEPSRRRVYELELILDIALRVCTTCGKYLYGQGGSRSIPARLPVPASGCLWEILGRTPEYKKPEKMTARGSKRTERKGKRGTGPRGWLPEGFPSHLHRTSIVSMNVNGLWSKGGGWTRNGLCGRFRGRKSQ